MRMDELGDVRRRCLPVVDELALGDQLADARADQVNSEHRTAAGHGDDLRRALRLQDLALAIAREVIGELGGLDSACRRGGRRNAHRGNLGVAVGDPRHPVIVDRGDLQAAEPLGHHDPLGEPDVSQLGTRGEVADSGDRRHIRLAVAVDGDVAALHGHSRLRVAEPGRDRPAADRDEQQVGIDGGAALERDGHPGPGVLDSLEPGAGLLADAAPPEGPLQQLRARFLLGRQQMRQHLHDRDLGAERPPDAGELHSDDPAAKDHHRRRHLVEGEGLVAGDHALAVDGEAGQAAGLGPGGQDDVRALDDGVPDLDLGRRYEPPVAFDDVDVPGRDQPLQALPQPGDYLVLVGVDPGHVDAFERGPHSEVAALPGHVGNLGGVQQRFRRDAAAVQAGTADLALLDQRDALAKLRGAQRAGVAAAAAAEDDDVVPAAFRHHELLVRSVSPGLPQRGPAVLARPAYSRPSATSSAICTSARAAAPVPPFEVYPYGSPSWNEGPAMSRCAQRTPGGTNSFRKRPATSMPPCRSPVTLARSATGESRPLRSSSGSGMGQAISPARRKASTTPSRTASSLAITPLIRGPRATSWAPVRVATSTSRSGESAADLASASASTRRPSASVFSTSTVVPPKIVMTSDGRCAVPLGMFSASGMYPTTFTAGPSAASACMAARTAAAPPMSDFIVSMALGGFSERPPESNVMPLPAKTTVLVAPGGGKASRTSRGGRTEPCPTPVMPP